MPDPHVPDQVNRRCSAIRYARIESGPRWPRAKTQSREIGHLLSRIWPLDARRGVTCRGVGEDAGVGMARWGMVRRVTPCTRRPQRYAHGRGAAARAPAERYTRCSALRTEAAFHTTGSTARGPVRHALLRSASAAVGPGAVMLMGLTSMPADTGFDRRCGRRRALVRRRSGWGGLRSGQNSKNAEGWCRDGHGLSSGTRPLIGTRSRFPHAPHRPPTGRRGELPNYRN
jgi:hypothetical protein